MAELNYDYDPLGRDALQALLITNMKIYDVLMALLGEANPQIAHELDEMHSNGIVLGLGPQFSHFFNRSTGENSDGTRASDESIPPTS